MAIHEAVPRLQFSPLCYQLVARVLVVCAHGAHAGGRRARHSTCAAHERLGLRDTSSESVDRAVPIVGDVAACSHDCSIDVFVPALPLAACVLAGLCVL